MPGIDDAVGVQWRNGGFHDHILTDFYEETLVDARNNVTAWYDMVAAEDKDIVGGKFVVWPVHEGRNEGVGYMDARGNLPDPGSQGFDTFVTHLKDFYGRIKIDGKTFRSASHNAASYLDAVDTEMQGALIDAKIDWQRAAFNDGSGRLAEVTVVGAGGALTLGLHTGITNSTTCDNDPTQWIEARMRVMFVTSAGASPVTKVIQQVVDGTQVVVGDTFAGAADNTGVVVGDWAVRGTREGTTDTRDSGYRNEPPGLEGFFKATGIFDGNGLPPAGATQTGSYDNTGVSAAAAGFQGILATAAFPWNQAVINDNGGTPRDNSEALMQALVSDAEKQNNSNIDMILSSYESYDQYVANLVIFKRFNDTGTLVGGHKVLDFNGVPWYKDKDEYRNRVRALDLSQFRRKEVAPLNWLNQDGSIWSRVTDKDAWEAAFNLTHTCTVKLRQRIGATLVDLNA
ncbi:MAG: phage major capsid protein [bacterium]|nr:phage major capsid protein [bacterium]